MVDKNLAPQRLDGRHHVWRAALVVGLSAFAYGGIPGHAVAAEFTIAAGTEPDTMDVQRQTSGAVQNYVEFVVESLVKLQEDGSFLPSLAESWTVSDDGMVYTFNLRKNVKFQDGTAFDAEAAKFNFDRLMDENVRVPLRKWYSGITSVEVADTHSIIIRLKEPAPAFLGSMAAVVVGMMSPASIEKHGNTYDLIVHPVGTGPYKFVEYVKAGHIKFERWDSYWGKQPYYETQVIKLMPEPASREAAILSGQVDMVMQPPSADIESLRANPKLEVLIGRSTRVVYLAFNNKSEKFADPRVRQALNYAIDREAIIKNVLFNTATATHSPLSQYMASYCNAGSYGYDPKKSRALLSEAGATDLKIELIAPSGHYIQDRQAAQAIAAYLQQVGVKASVRTTDWATYLSWVAEPADKQGARMNMFGYAGNSPQQATPGFVSFIGSASVPPAGFNTSFYSNKEVDRIWAEASREMVDDKRDKLYCDAQKIIWQDAPWLFLWNQGVPIVTTSNITGVYTTPNERFVTVYARPKDK